MIHEVNAVGPMRKGTICLRQWGRTLESDIRFRASELFLPLLLVLASCAKYFPNGERRSITSNVAAAVVQVSMNAVRCSRHGCCDDLSRRSQGCVDVARAALICVNQMGESDNRKDALLGTSLNFQLILVSSKELGVTEVSIQIQMFSDSMIAAWTKVKARRSVTRGMISSELKGPGDIPFTISA